MSSQDVSADAFMSQEEILRTQTQLVSKSKPNTGLRENLVENSETDKGSMANRSITDKGSLVHTEKVNKESNNKIALVNDSQSANQLIARESSMGNQLYVIQSDSEKGGEDGQGKNVDDVDQIRNPTPGTS
jgi:hypothetical protein